MTKDEALRWADGRLRWERMLAELHAQERAAAGAPASARREPDRAAPIAPALRRLARSL